MSHWPRRLSLRLALMFALVSMLVLGLLGTYLYHSLTRELAWRDDQALLGRLQRMQALLADSAGIQALQQRPALYENMLGNRDSLLWLLDAQGQALISINPSNAQLPTLPASPQPRLTNATDHEGLRLAWQTLDSPQGSLTLIAGRSLAERQQMLASYRLRLWLALANLLANALRHATPGSCIQVSSLQDSQHCTISVHNQGQAIAAEHLPYLFERFYRCDPSRQ